MKRFADLTEHEVLALAISNKDGDSRIYCKFANGFRDRFSVSAKRIDAMADEEIRHRFRLSDLIGIS